MLTTMSNLGPVLSMYDGLVNLGLKRPGDYFC
jgi:hypothetical protein